MKKSKEGEDQEKTEEETGEETGEESGEEMSEQQLFSEQQVKSSSSGEG